MFPSALLQLSPLCFQGQTAVGLALQYPVRSHPSPWWPGLLCYLQRVPLSRWWQLSDLHGIGRHMLAVATRSLAMSHAALFVLLRHLPTGRVGRGVGVRAWRGEGSIWFLLPSFSALASQSRAPTTKMDALFLSLLFLLPHWQCLWVSIHNELPVSFGNVNKTHYMVFEHFGL